MIIKQCALKHMFLRNTTSALIGAGVLIRPNTVFWEHGGPVIDRPARLLCCVE